MPGPPYSGERIRTPGKPHKTGPPVEADRLARNSFSIPN